MTQPVSLEILGFEYLLDPTAASVLSLIPAHHWEMNAVEGRPRLQPRAGDRELVPGLVLGRTYGLSTLAYLAVRRALPERNHVPVFADGNPLNVQMSNMTWLSRAEHAKVALQPQVDPDGGITELPSGRFRARAYVNGALRGVGSFNTREEAREARDFALAHPESMPSDKPKNRKPKEAAVPASKHKATERQLLQLRTENAQLKAKIDAMQRQLDLYAPAF